jgi:hypothetical protein
MVATFIGIMVALRLYIIPAFIGLIGTTIAGVLLVGIVLVAKYIDVRDRRPAPERRPE